MQKTVLKWVIFVVIVINLMIVAVVLVSPTPLPTRALPVPNGYDDFLKAGTLVISPPDNLDQIAREQLSDSVASNAEALKTVRTGLTRECVTPVPKSVNDKHMAVLGSFKSIQRAFMAEAQLSQRNGRPDDAARSYLDSIRMGQEIVRGGLLIDSLVGLALENNGTTALARLVDSLAPATCRELAVELGSMISKRERAADIQAQESAYSRRIGGWRWRVLRFVWLFTGKGDPLKPALQNHLAKDQAVQIQLQNLLTKLEARATSK